MTCLYSMEIELYLEQSFLEGQRRKERDNNDLSMCLHIPNHSMSECLQFNTELCYGKKEAGLEDECCKK